MKPTKSDVSEGYTSDDLLSGPEHLALVIRSFLLHGTVTKCLLACAFLPLLKPRKDPVKTDSYRAIAGSSLILKLIDNVILLLWGDLLGSDSLQFGFKAKVSTTQCTWLVQEVASYFMRRGTAVTACFLDCSKAFAIVGLTSCSRNPLTRACQQLSFGFSSSCIKSKLDGLNLEERNPACLS